MSRKKTKKTKGLAGKESQRKLGEGVVEMRKPKRKKILRKEGMCPAKWRGKGKKGKKTKF